MECFFDDFPAHGSPAADVWLIEPPPDLKRAAVVRVQRQLERFPWLVPIPEHFLHVSLGEAAVLDERSRDWPGTGAFEIEYRHINCFHSAVVVEAHSRRLHELIGGTSLDPRIFLPHLTVAVTREERAPDDLRSVLVSLREVELGTTTTGRATRVRVPAARTTVLQPWELTETVVF